MESLFAATWPKLAAISLTVAQLPAIANILGRTMRVQQFFWGFSVFRYCGEEPTKIQFASSPALKVDMGHLHACSPTFRPSAPPQTADIGYAAGLHRSSPTFHRDAVLLLDLNFPFRFPCSLQRAGTGPERALPRLTPYPLSAPARATRTFCSLLLALLAFINRMRALSYNYCIMTVFFYSIK